MNRFAIPAIKSVAAEIGARASKFATGRVANASAELRNLVTANLVEVLSVAGGAASVSLTDITLTIAIAVITRIFKRLNGTLPAFHP
ncbi:hypothetical protein DIE23_34215 [Burkholderia sp. Bp9143]|uniref:hypothetical protein n=1 Tax=Burkholderia sp. Bp9143 TaxID=2184574 RepID=UPI000F59DBC3|nr:hypothetical protein [Burkholderia sp. Bp9143]RQR24052.1 hypothetical protein DIE23_34215 [Burkholderia sp. Bp9143]